MARKNWTEKFEHPKPREVKPAPQDFADIKAGQTMLLPTPGDIADVLRNVPKGKQIDLKALRADLARRHGADTACPIVTGIQLRVVAEVTGERLEAGLPVIRAVPVCRVVGPKAAIWKKLEHGRERFAALRRLEKLAD